MNRVAILPHSAAVRFHDDLKVIKEQHNHWESSLELVEIKVICREAMGVEKWHTFTVENSDDGSLDEKCADERLEYQSLREEVHQKLIQWRVYPDPSNEWAGVLKLSDEPEADNDMKRKYESDAEDSQYTEKPAKLRRQTYPQLEVDSDKVVIQNLETILDYTCDGAAALQTRLEATEDRLQRKSVELKEIDKSMKEKIKHKDGEILAIKKQSADDLAAHRMQTKDWMVDQHQKFAELNSTSQLLAKTATEASSENKSLKTMIDELNHLIQFHEGKATVAESRILVLEGDLEKVLRAQQNLELRKEEMIADVSLAAPENDELREKIKGSQKAHDNEKQKYFQQISDHLASKNEALKAADALRTEKNALTRASDDAVRTSKDCKADNQILWHQTDFLEKQLAEKFATADDLKLQVRKMRNAKYSLKEKLEDLREGNVKAVTDLKLKVKKLEKCIQQLENEKTTLTRQVEENEEENIHKLNDITDLTSALSIRDKELAAYSSRAEAAEKTRDELQRKASELNIRLTNTENERNEWELRAEAAAARAVEMERKHRDLEVKHEKLQDEIKAVNTHKEKFANLMNTWPSGSVPQEEENVVGQPQGSPPARANRRSTARPQTSNAEGDKGEADNDDDPGALSRPGYHWVNGVSSCLFGVF